MEEKETRAKQLMGMLKKKNQSDNNSAIIQKSAEPEQKVVEEKINFPTISQETGIEKKEQPAEQYKVPAVQEESQPAQQTQSSDKTRAKQLISILKKNSPQTQIKEEEGEKIQYVPSPIVSKDEKKIFFGRERYKPKVEKLKLTKKEQEKREEKLLGKKQGIRGMLYRRFVKKGEEETQHKKRILFKKPKQYPKFTIYPSKVFLSLLPKEQIKFRGAIYPLIKPYSYVNIRFDPKEKEITYNVIEPILTEREKLVLEKLKDGMIQIIDVSLEDVKNQDAMLGFLEKNIQHILEQFDIDLTESEYLKIMYYIYRDFVGLNEIEPLLHDPYIEDIGCLPEHEKIFVKLDGNIKLVSIGELIESEMLKKDETAIEKTKRKIEILSFNPKTLKTEYKEIDAVMRRKNKEGHYIRIQVEGGNEINVSPDHPMIVLTKNGLETKRADSLEKGEYVLRVKHFSDEIKIADIDLIEEFSKIDLNIRIKGTKSLLKNNMQCAKKLSVSNRLVANWKSNDTMPLWAYLKLETNKENRKNIKIGYQGGKNWIPAIIKPDEDLALFIGLFLAEGYFESFGISLAFGKHEGDLSRMSKEIGEKLFGVHSTIMEKKTSKTVYFGGKALLVLFRDILKIGKDSFTKQVPEIAYNWSENLLANVVKGYFLGDGYIRGEDRIKKAVVPTASYNLLLGIRHLLFRLGLNTKVYDRKRFANTWEISLELGKNIESFSKMILGKESKSYGSAATERLPSFLFSSDDFKGVERKIVNKSTKSQGRLGLKYALKSRSEMINKLLSGDVHPVKVLDIEYVEYRKPFYDLKVKDNSNFMHGFIFTHNCDGIMVPNYVVHRKYGSVKTNISFDDEEQLKDLVIKLAERCDRYISYAEPLLDGSLPDGTRVNASLASDVTTRGPTFSIRKFREIPYSPVDMVNLKTASPEMLAYIWFVVENGANILLAGGVATGKTSFLNMVSLFIPPESKIVSIEDTRELSLPHENWIPGVARVGFTASGVGEVSMFDLLRESFRQNPDYLIVGEIRGKEAYVMFQAMSSGHPSMATMHAGSVDDVIKRLQTEPINLSPGLLESLDLIIVMIHAREKGKSARRAKELDEIESVDIHTGKARISKAFVWLPASDIYEYRGDSWLLYKIATEKGYPMPKIIEELEKRRKLIQWMIDKNMTDIAEVIKYIGLYKRKPEVLKDIIGAEEGKTEEKEDSRDWSKSEIIDIEAEEKKESKEEGLEEGEEYLWEKKEKKDWNKAEEIDLEETEEEAKAKEGEMTEEIAPKKVIEGEIKKEQETPKEKTDAGKAQHRKITKKKYKIKKKSRRVKIQKYPEGHKYPVGHKEKKQKKSMKNKIRKRGKGK